VLKAVTRVFADTLHGTEEPGLTLRMLLQELVDGLSRVERDTKGTIFGSCAVLVLLQRFRDLGTGWEHLSNAVTVPVPHRTVASQQRRRRSVNDMVWTVFAEDAVEGGLPHDRLGLRQRESDFGGDGVVGRAAIDRDGFKEAKMVDALLHGVVDGLSLSIVSDGTGLSPSHANLTPQHIRLITSPGPWVKS